MTVTVEKNVCNRKIKKDGVLPEKLAWGLAFPEATRAGP